VGLQLLENAVATSVALVAIILVVGPGPGQAQGLAGALLRYAEARHDGAVISAWAQIAMANSSNATANHRFAGSSVASS
jgi:predicted anti-sigma-YlaC factor YlaD